MELRTLRNFAAVARAGNVTRAAAALHVSQPALSMQLRELEEEMGGPLLVRRPRGVEPTERGALLLRRADDLLALAERARDEVRGEGGAGLSGTLALGAGETEAFGTLGRAIAELCAENPGLRVELTSGNAEQMDDGVRAGTLDLVLLVGPGRQEGFDYVVLPHVHRWGLYVRRGEPLAARRRIGPKDLARVRLVTTRQAGVREFLSGWLGSDFHALDIAATYNLCFNAFALVASGLGAAVSIDGMLPEVFSDRLVFVPFGPALRSDTYLAWKKGARLSPAAAALVDRVRETTDAHPAARR